MSNICSPFLPVDVVNTTLVNHVNSASLYFSVGLDYTIVLLCHDTQNKIKYNIIKALKSV